MNLKLVVASMSILGLVSCPVLAVAHTKHHHHHKHHHHLVTHHDYKGMEPMAIQPPPVEVCSITQETMILDGMTQNMGRAIPNPCNPDWWKRIQLSGGFNIDIGKWGNRNANYMGENYQRISFNDAYFNLQAIINDWTHAFASISYNTATINDPTSTNSTTSHHVAEFDAAYSANAAGGATSALQLEQAFITFANFDMSPVFVQLGKQFQDFGRYEIHPITESLTQVMSKTLAASAKIGFITNGFNGSVFVFEDPISKVGQTSTTTNYGVALGYDQPSDQLGFDIGAAYLYNLIGVNDIAYAVNQFNLNASPNFFNGYHNRASGLALYGDINSGPFVLGARYTTALQSFNANDLPKNGTADVNWTTGVVYTTASGAKPWAAGIQAAYGFDAWCKTHNIYLGYQASHNAGGLLIPKSRWLAGYNVDFWKWTNFGIEWDQDQAYSKSHGGTGNNTHLVSLRAAVKFG